MPITIDGTGSISGLSAGGLPDLSVQTADLAAGAVTQAKRSEDLTLATAQTATGTAVDFTGIPSWVKRITVLLSGVSMSGTDGVLIRLGTSSGIETSGYLGAAGNRSAEVSSTGGFRATYGASVASSDVWMGMVIICNVTGNFWIAQAVAAEDSAAQPNCYSVGSKELSGALDRLRVTTTGSNTFDAGTINILYE